MAREIQAFQVTVPAGTLQSAPQVSTLAMPPRIVRRVEIVVPAGALFQVGFQLAMAGTQVIPYTRGAFVVTDDEKIGWDLEGQSTSGAWELIAYNTGLFPHTLYFRFLVDLPEVAVPASGGLLEPGSIGSDGSGLPPAGVLPPASQDPPPIPDPAPLPPPPAEPPPPTPAPPPAPAPPGAGGGTIADDMPTEVISETVVVTSPPYDVVIGANPALAGGHLILRNPGAAAVTGRAVAVSFPDGSVILDHVLDFNLQPGQGVDKMFSDITGVYSVVLQSASGPLSVAWKTSPQGR